jgi:RimJ/RimL family protein N-acetyltransferase
MPKINPKTYHAVETLRDGTGIRIRAIRPDDADRLHQHFLSLSPESVYFRFMGFKRDLSPEELKKLTEVDFVNHVALVATISDAERDPIIGVGRYIRGIDPRRAEVGLVILDHYQGRGIGTILLRHLSIIGHDGGVEELEGNVMADNHKMLEVFEHSGFKARRSLESGVIHLSFPVEDVWKTRGAQ